MHLSPNVLILHQVPGMCVGIAEDLYNNGWSFLEDNITIFTDARMAIQHLSDHRFHLDVAIIHKDLHEGAGMKIEDFTRKFWEIYEYKPVRYIITSREVTYSNNWDKCVKLMARDLQASGTFDAADSVIHCVPEWMMNIIKLGSLRPQELDLLGNTDHFIYSPRTAQNRRDLIKRWTDKESGNGGRKEID